MHMRSCRLAILAAALWLSAVAIAVPAQPERTNMPALGDWGVELLATTPIDVLHSYLAFH